MSTTTETREAIEQVDPRTLVIAANVRGIVDLDREFVASIRDLGVLEPVTVVREGEELRVRYGQRRMLGAVQAGAATIPVPRASASAVAGDCALRAGLERVS